MAGRLNQSIRRASRFALGGIAAVLAIDTTEGGKPTLAVTHATPGDRSTRVTDIDLAAGITATPQLLEPEDGADLAATFTDNVTIGANRFPTPTLGMKFSENDEDYNAVIKAFALGKTTFLIRFVSGKIRLAGEQNGLQATQANVSYGGKREDFAGMDVVLSGAELHFAPEVDQAAWDALLALVPAEA